MALNTAYKERWWDDNCRWPETSIEFDTDETPVTTLLELHDEQITWLYENIDNCERHCRWVIERSYFKFRFRHERDQLMFILRWA